MDIACTGTLLLDGTRVIRGAATRFLLELRPGDTVRIDTGTYIVKAVASDVQALLNFAPTYSATPVRFYLTAPNPFFLLAPSMPSYQYANSTFDYGFTSYNCLYGGQVFDGNGRCLSTLSSYKALSLPEGYNYTAPFEKLTVVNTTAGSSSLTVAQPATNVATTKDSKVIKYLSGDTYPLYAGMEVCIEGVNFTINSISFPDSSQSGYWTNAVITLDKAVGKTMSIVKLLLNVDLASMFPPGSYVLLNGKLDTITRAAGSVLQVRYPISDTAKVTVRKPLMATQYGANSVEFFNITVPTGWLQNGNLLIVQDFRSEDKLFEVNSCYTEIKHIARRFEDNSVVTNEPHNVSFSGLVCIGRPSYGIGAVPFTATGNGTGFTTSFYLPYMNVGDYCVINGEFYRIEQTSSYSVRTDRATPTGTFNVYSVLNISAKSYTDRIVSLTKKLVESVINTGMTRTSTVDKLSAEFLTNVSVACLAQAQKIVTHSVYDPLMFAVNEYSAPPTSFTQHTALTEATIKGMFELEQTVLRRCGLPITSA